MPRWGRKNHEAVRHEGTLERFAGDGLMTSGAVRAHAPARIPRIGFLSAFSPSETAPWQQAFRLGLRDLGWVEGKNIIEYRYAEGRRDRIPDLAADLVRLKVDLIVASSTPEALAVKSATGAIPIVMAIPGDPVASGLVESLARPRRQRHRVILRNRFWQARTG